MIAEVLKELAPDAKWNLFGNDLSTLEWLSGDIPRPSDVEILSKVTEIGAKHLEQVKQINALYDDAILYLQNGYSDQEVKTFGAKREAANAVIAGTANDFQIYFLAHRKGFVNTAVPGTPTYLSDVAQEVSNLTAEQLATINNDAQKIIAASYVFDHFSSLCENLRDQAISNLSGNNPDAVVANLKNAYESMKNA